MLTWYIASFASPLHLCPDGDAQTMELAMQTAHYDPYSLGGQYHDKAERLAKGCAGLLLSEGCEPNNYASFHNVQTESHIWFAATLFSVYTGTTANAIWVLVLLRNTSVLFSPSCRGYSVCNPSMQLQTCSGFGEKVLYCCTCGLSVLSSRL